MALKKSEQKLIGIGLIAGGLAVVIGVGLPQWDSYSASNTQLTNLNEEMQSLKSQKEMLASQIALLEKNTDIPAGIEVKTYTSENREQVIKQLLDHVVSLSTDAGNRFVSLAPTEVAPILPPPPPPEKGKDGKKADAKKSDKAEEEEVPSPILNTFGYELVMRGTYDSVQRFLKTMSEQTALLEISTITLENEVGNATNVSADKILDPANPIRMTATLRLALQPVER